MLVQGWPTRESTPARNARCTACSQMPRSSNGAISSGAGIQEAPSYARPGFSFPPSGHTTTVHVILDIFSRNVVGWMAADWS